MKAELKTYVDDLKYGGKKAEYQELPIVECQTWWQKKGLSFTRSGYGSAIPTSYKVKHDGRLKRVYCSIFSNCGTLYIKSKGSKIIVEVER